MTTASVELLLELLDQPSPILSGATLEDFVLADAAPLIEASLLKQSGHNATATSVEGDDLPVALVWQEGSYGYFGESGWVDVESGRLAGHIVDVEALCRRLLPGQKSPPIQELVPGLLWDLGAIRLPNRTPRVPAVLARRTFDVEAWRETKSWLIQRPERARIVIVASARRRSPDDMPPGNTIAFLGDVIDGDRVTLKLDALAAILDRRAIANTDEPVMLIADGREVRLHGRRFRFPKGDKQRRILCAIYERYRAGERMTSWAEIAEQLDLGGRLRLRDYFKKSKPAVIGHLLKEEGGMVGFCLSD